MAFLEIRNLSVEFATSRGPLRAVDGVDLDVNEGEVLCVVGEFGLGQERVDAGGDGADQRSRPRDR